MATFTVTNSNDSGTGSLRAAIAAANATTEADTITFDPGLMGSIITLTSGELLISQSLTIVGLGADRITINGNNASRIFQVNQGSSTINVTLTGLNLTNGRTTGSEGGGGILNQENLTIRDSIISSNTAADDGGGIENGGTLQLINSVVEANESIGTSEFSGGGGIFNLSTGTVAIVDSAIVSNAAIIGGGIRNDGVLAIANSTLSGNTAITAGGAIANTSEPDPGGEPSYAGKATLRNVTITENSALGLDRDLNPIPDQEAFGSGIANLAAASAGGFLNLANTIVAGNIGQYVEFDDLADSVTFFIELFPGLFVPITVDGQTISAGNNLIGNGDYSAAFNNGQNGDQVGTTADPLAPGLGSLALDGSLTPSHALLFGSLAINAGANSQVPADGIDQDSDGNLTEWLPLDQTRLRNRILGGTVDIGAVEYQDPSAPDSPTDFNNDGLTDIVWRNQRTGQVGFWFMDGGNTRIGFDFSINENNLNWEIQGVADFDNDNQSDLIWRNRSTGENVVWIMDGATKESGSFLLPAVSDRNWEIQGTGDFDNDGQVDLLWRNQSTGQNALWLMNPNYTRREGLLLNVTVNSDVNRDGRQDWQMGGVGDFNGDGEATDILWRNYVTGEIGLWYMDVNIRTGFASLQALTDLNWEIQGVSDLDNDGVNDDILWRNRANGANAIWLNGSSTSGLLLDPVGANSGWTSIV